MSRGGLPVSEPESLRLPAGAGRSVGTQAPRRCRLGRAVHALGGQPPAAPAELGWGVPSGVLPQVSAAGETGEAPGLLRAGLQSPPGKSLVSLRFCQHALPSPPHEPLEFDSNCLMERERLPAVKGIC